MLYSFQELSDLRSDFTCMGFKSKVAGVVEMDFRILVIPSKRFCAGRQEKRIVLAPHGEQRRALLAEVLLKLWIKCHIAGVIKKEIELDFVIAGTRKQCGIEYVGFGGDNGSVGHAVSVLPFSCFGFEKVAQSSAV